jgi:PAS domain S-box-containing protein/excisionase family DNA binding protein
MTEATAVRRFGEYLTVGEAAELLGISPWTLRNWDNSGKLTSSRHPVSGYRIYRREDLEALLQTGGLLGKRRRSLTPNLDWSEIGDKEHFVQFYENDSYLVESVSTYVGQAIVAGEGTLMIATQGHRDRIHRKLKRRGLDVSAARECGQFLALDAAETLSEFMADDSPDPELFEQSVGERVRQLAQRWPRVRAFGEMVALLWAAGNRGAACRVEGLWNDLAKRHSFALFCAYPINGFHDEADGISLNDICASHSRVIPAEGYSALSTPAEQLRAIAILQQKAQRLEAEIGQRKEAERELADFFENAVEGLHKVGPDGRIIWANKAELDLLGYEPDEYIGHDIAEFYVDRDVIDDMLRRLLSGERLFNRPARLRCKDGSVKHVLIHSNGYFKDGRFIYSRCFTRDVTEIKQAERDRAMLAAIIESSEDAIISKTFDGIIRSWNAGAERLFGYTEGEAVGQPITFIIPPERLQEEKDILQRLRRGERIEHYETVRVAKDGRRIDVSLTISPLRDSDGNLVGASKIARDITARKRADAALRESEHRFSSFMQALPGLAWIKDESGRYIFANDAVQKPFGVSPEELYGKTDHDVFSLEAAAQFSENDRRALTSEKGVEVIESLEHEDGIHYSIVSKFPIPDADGKPAYVGGVAIDITERLQAEEALREADRRKDEFLATLAHELRNPLAPISNSIRILRMSGQNGPAAERVHEMMERQVTHMVRLVDDLLEISRISRGKIALQTERVGLANVINHAVDTSRPLVENGAHTLEVCLPDDPVTVEGDPVRLSQVFANLLNNAAKYTDKGGTITVTAQCEGDDVVVSVRDTGVGLPRTMLSRVFDMFSQIDNPLRRSQDGLGIGLSLVRTLVLMHGGSVEARSEGLGHGSEFIVRLPRVASESSDVDGTRSSVDEGTGILSACRILAVDDNSDSVDSLGTILRFLGADVQVAYDGPSALERVKIFRPSVILMDLGMPGMDGCEVARLIRQEPENRKVVLIAMTGWGEEEDRRRSREAGFDHHLVKPIDLSALQALLASLKITFPLVKAARGNEAAPGLIE